LIPPGGLGIPMMIGNFVRDPHTQALAVYDLMCSSSRDRPFSGDSLGELNQKINTWQRANPALTLLRESEPAVHLAFLEQSFEWLKANGDLRGNFRLCHTLSDGIISCLGAYAPPLPSELLLHLLSQYRQDYSMARFYFPFELLLSRLTREQMTEAIRNELRKIQLQLAPSPTGKIEARAQATRDRIAELTFCEGERPLDPGRGPWSQLVFDELKTKEPILRSGCEALLEHCKTLEQAAPSAKWKKRAGELLEAMGEGEATGTLVRWLAIGPIPGQSREARSPIEDSQYQKGLLWCLASRPAEQVAVPLADFGLACLRKIRMLGAVSQKVGLAAIQALGAMASREAIAQLTRMRATIRYATARRLIDKSLRSAAGKMGLTVDELEDYAVDGFGLDEQGSWRAKVGHAEASLELLGDGRVRVVWKNTEGKIARSVPSRVKKQFPDEVRAVSIRAKGLEQAYRAQKSRLEASLPGAREMPLSHWQQYFVEHPVLGSLGRRLIWVFRNAEGSEHSALWLDGKMRHFSGKPAELWSARTVRLWHPLSTDLAERQAWRDVVFQHRVRQPFRQAFREFYEMTDGERETRLYSNRFAGILMRQHQFASLCKERGWGYRLMGTHFDGGNVPTRKLEAWKIHAEFYVDLPADRNPSLRDSGLGEHSPAGIGMFVGSDQVRFYRESKEIALEDVPALVYSEIMRDVDLFTSVCAVGEDETWSDQGDRGVGILTKPFDLAPVTALISLRADLLCRILPHTRIADRARVEKSWLEVRGQLGTYQIHLGWSGAALMTEKSARWLRIPPKILAQVELGLADLPVDLDYRTEMALRKAYVLAEDGKIDSPDLIRQLMGE